MILSKGINYLQKDFVPELTLEKKKPLPLVKVMEMSSASYTYLNDIALENAFAYFYMLDITQGKYLFLSKSVQNLLGFNNEFLINQGPAYANDYIHEEDQEKLKTVLKRIMDCFYKFPISERKNLKFEYNFRIKRYDGNFIHLLQQVSFVEVSSKGEPLISYNTCTDISGYKHDNSIRLTGFKIENRCSKKLFEQNICDGLKLTKRQKEILELISKGMTSSEIAACLYLSTETVKNHRKKILATSKAKNMVEAMKLVNWH